MAEQKDANAACWIEAKISGSISTPPAHALCARYDGRALGVLDDEHTKTHRMAREVIEWPQLELILLRDSKGG